MSMAIRRWTAYRQNLSGRSVIKKTTFASKGSSIPLPEELIVEIFVYLDVCMLVRCRQVCIQFRGIIDFVPLLQYQLELSVAGLQPSCDTASRGIEEQRIMLAQFQASRKQDHTAELFQIERPDNATNYPPRRCDRTGNIFLSGYSTLPSAHDLVVNYDSLRCYTLKPGYAADGTASRWELQEQWDETLPPGISFQHWLSDASQAVIVLFDRKSRLLICSFSQTGLSIRSTINIFRPYKPCWSDSITEKQIIGDIIGISQYNFDPTAGPNALGMAVTIVNWKHAKVVAQLCLCNDGTSLICCKTFTMLSNDSFIIGVITANTMAIRVYAFGPAVTSERNDTAVIIPTHVASFELPSWRAENNIQLNSARVIRPQCTANSATLRSFSQFISAEPYGMIIFLLELLDNQNSHVSITPVFVAHPLAFLSAISVFHARSSSEAIIYPWATWGPKSTRCFERHNMFLQWDQSDGFRFPVPLPDSSGLTLLDFSPLDVRRDIDKVPPSRRRIFNRDILSRKATSAAESSGLRIRSQPTTVKFPRAFVDDITTSLPYREIIVKFPHVESGTSGRLSVDTWLQVVHLPAAGLGKYHILLL